MTSVSSMGVGEGVRVGPAVGGMRVGGAVGGTGVGVEVGGTGVGVAVGGGDVFVVVGGTADGVAVGKTALVVAAGGGGVAVGGAPHAPQKSTIKTTVRVHRPTILSLTGFLLVQTVFHRPTRFASHRASRCSNSRSRLSWVTPAPAGGSSRRWRSRSPSS